MEFLAPPIWLVNPFSHVCTTMKFLRALPIFSMNFWCSLWRKTLKEGIDTPNFCSPQRFGLSHLPIPDIHQTVISSSCTFFFFFTSIQLCSSQVTAHSHLLSPCSKRMLWQSVCNLDSLGFSKRHKFNVSYFKYGSHVVPTSQTGKEYHGLLRIK